LTDISIANLLQLEMNAQLHRNVDTSTNSSCQNVICSYFDNLWRPLVHAWCVAICATWTDLNYLAEPSWRWWPLLQH